MQLGNQIHQLRKLSGMTQEQLAEKLNVSRQTVSKWESDTTMPDLESMVRICRIFQLSLDELVLKEEESMTERPDISYGKRPWNHLCNGSERYYIQHPIYAVPLYYRRQLC